MTPELAPEPINTSLFGDNIRFHKPDHIDDTDHGFKKLKDEAGHLLSGVSGNETITAAHKGSLKSINKAISTHNSAEHRLASLLSEKAHVILTPSEEFEQNPIIVSAAEIEGKSVEQLISDLTIQLAEYTLDAYRDVIKTNKSLPPFLQEDNLPISQLVLKAEIAEKAAIQESDKSRLEQDSKE